MPESLWKSNHLDFLFIVEQLKKKKPKLDGGEAKSWGSE